MGIDRCVFVLCVDVMCFVSRSSYLPVLSRTCLALSLVLSCVACGGSRRIIFFKATSRETFFFSPSSIQEKVEG